MITKYQDRSHLTRDRPVADFVNTIKKTGFNEAAEYLYQRVEHHFLKQVSDPLKQF
jgi:hypothetical protein